MPANTATSAQFAQNEVNANSWGLYIHVPFCRSKCIYCDFYSRPCAFAQSAYTAYANRIKEEYRARLHEVRPLLSPSTIYFGGGTPSALPADTLADLISWAADLGKDTSEFTVEINPDDIDNFVATLSSVHSVLPNRVSMGVQSLIDKELRAIGRRHTAADALQAVKRLRQAGIGNISCDLIYGLPAQTLSSFRESLIRLLDTGIEHLSAYILSYEPSTALWRLREKGKIVEAPDSLIEDMYGLLCQTTAEAGFEHYEISSFAREGFRSRHNSSYWNSTPYLGLGPAAHSLAADGVRRYNRSDSDAYLRGEDTLCVDEESPSSVRNDYIIMRLRTADGLSVDHFRTLYGHEAAVALARRLLGQIETNNLILTPDNRYRIPENLWLTSDAIMLNIIE